MSEASFASLGPTLLARKGGAKPAMRPQLAPLPDVVAAEQLEDLGWNDMGSEDQAHEAETSLESADIVSIKPVTTHQAANEDIADLTPEDALIGESPLAVRQPRDLTTNLLSDAVPDEPVELVQPKRKSRKKSAVTKPKPAKSSSAKGRRAAFTLRLNRDRHLKLRLASTMQGISAQALVTQALDAMLSEIEDLDSLVASLDGRVKNN